MPWIFRSLLGISIALLPLFCYVGLRLVSSIGKVRAAYKRRAYLCFLIIVAWLILLPLAFFLLPRFGLGSTVNLRETLGWDDYLFRYPLWVGMIIVLELASPFILVDLVAMAIRWIPALPQRWATFLPYLRLALAPLVATYVVARVVLDTGCVRDSVETIPIAGLPPELAGLTITMVSDIQLDQYTGEGKVGQIRNIVDARRPDILFSGGDLVTSGTQFLDKAPNAICGLSGSLASVAVLGDHDTRSSPQAIREVHRKCGWMFMDNEHRLFSYRGRSILITGLTHTYRDRFKTKVLREFLSKAPGADLKILLVHQPAEVVVRAAAEEGYALLFAGHTHGGQIIVHPLGIPFTPVEEETPFYQGVYREGGTTIIVTRGIGLTTAPIRYHAPAEVTTVTLAINENR